MKEIRFDNLKFNSLNWDRENLISLRNSNLTDLCSNSKGDKTWRVCFLGKVFKLLLHVTNNCNFIQSLFQSGSPSCLHYRQQTKSLQGQWTMSGIASEEFYEIKSWSSLTVIFCLNNHFKTKIYVGLAMLLPSLQFLTSAEMGVLL